MPELPHYVVKIPVVLLIVNVSAPGSPVQQLLFTPSLPTLPTSLRYIRFGLFFRDWTFGPCVTTKIRLTLKFVEMLEDNILECSGVVRKKRF